MQKLNWIANILSVTQITAAYSKGNNPNGNRITAKGRGYKNVVSDTH